jgi:hypothetical protein
VRCVPRVLIQPFKMKSAVLAPLGIYVMVKQVRNTQHFSDSIRVRYVRKATTAHRAPTSHHRALSAHITQKWVQAASLNVYYVPPIHSTIGPDRVAADHAVHMPAQLRGHIHANALATSVLSQ